MATSDPFVLKVPLDHRELTGLARDALTQVGIGHLEPAGIGEIIEPDAYGLKRLQASQKRRLGLR